MRIIGMVLGVAVGLFAAVWLGVPMLGDCFWEQGCGRYHDLKVIGAVLASGLGGGLAGWGAASLCRKLVVKRHKQ